MIAEASVELVGENTNDPTGRRSAGPGVVLASRSPRRTQLLLEAGIEHDTEHPGFDDAVLEPGNVSPEQWVMSLAYLKAWARSRNAADGRFVIGADTTCVVDGRMFGTPRSEAEAAAMIRRFVGRTHDVLTGVAIVRSGGPQRRMFVDRATVTFGELAEDEIGRYVAGGAWQGKAGAYNLSERLAAGWPITFEGDPSTIMGLPMRRLRRELETLRRSV